MISEIVKDKVYYKIFDRDFKESSHRYNIHKAKTEIELSQIKQNRNIVKEYLKVDEIIFLNQVHGIDIIDADRNILPLDQEADGAITVKKNLAIAIKTADCVPLLMTNDTGTIIGAAHCGWLGSKKGIVNALITAMKNKGAQSIKALIGPCIHQKSYEVDRQYYESFLQDDTKNKEFFIPSMNIERYMFDLPGFIKYKLKENGINDIEQINENTYDNECKYPSFRRATHRNEENKFENLLSTIVIRN